MRKRILSILSVVAILATLLSVGIITASADTGVILSEAISGQLDSAMWTPNTKITDGKFYSTDGSKYTITSVEKYNLGTDWSAAIDFTTPTYFTGAVENTGVIIGDLEAVAVNNNGYANPKVNGYITLKVKGDEKGTRYSLGVGTDGWNSITNDGGYHGKLTLSYKNGIVTVNFKGADIITYDALGDALDFSSVNAGIIVTGNWVSGDDKFSVNQFSLTAANIGTGSSSEAPVSSNPASSEAPVSSDPASSEAPVSSDPASSEAPVSSDPASSEAPVSSDPASSEAPVSSDLASSEAPSAEKVTAAISGQLVAEMWDPSDSIVDGKLATGANAKEMLVTSVKKYDLGVEWEASMKFSTPTCMGNDAAQPTKLIVGDVEAVAYNSKGSSATPYIALLVNGVEKGRLELDATKSTTGGTGYGGTLAISFKNNNIVVNYNDDDIITYNAGSDSLDFSAVSLGLSTTGNWSADKNFKIVEFGIKTADTIPEKGETITTVTDATFNETDWTGDTSYIDATDGYFGVGSANKKTITTAKAYDLSGGFKYSATLAFKNAYTNYGGEYASMIVGTSKNGFELRIKNVSGQGMYTGILLHNGSEIATTDLLNAPNGKYEIVYKNGKVTVNLDGTALKWTLTDKSTSTSIALDELDLNSTNLGLHIEGNWAPASSRKWTNYSLSSASGSSSGANGSTGDFRNIAVAVAAIIMSVSIAFVVINRKSHEYEDFSCR